MLCFQDSSRENPSFLSDSMFTYSSKLFLFRSFPGDVYKPLLVAFSNVISASRSVASATKSLR